MVSLIYTSQSIHQSPIIQTIPVSPPILGRYTGRCGVNQWPLDHGIRREPPDEGGGDHHLTLLPEVRGSGKPLLRGRKGQESPLTPHPGPHLPWMEACLQPTSYHSKRKTPLSASTLNCYISPMRVLTKSYQNSNILVRKHSVAR